MLGILNKKNRGKKRGVIGMIILFVLLLTIVIVGFIAVMVISSVDYVSDEMTPIMTDLGVIDADGANVNMSYVGEITFGNANKIVQALPWLVALSYGMVLVFCFIFVLGLDIPAHPVFMGFYFILIILLFSII